MDKQRIKLCKTSFDAFTQHIVNEDNSAQVEVWLARDLQTILRYVRWENFSVAIQRAVESCKKRKINMNVHFRDLAKMIGIIIVLNFFFIIKMYADGSPVVQSLIVRGDYLFIRVNTGLYIVHEKDGRFYWDFDHEVYEIYENPDGMVCTLSATSYSTDKTCSDFRYFDGDNWIVYSYPKIRLHSDVRFFYFESKCHMIAEEADSEDIVMCVYDSVRWKEEARFPEAFRDNIPHTSLNGDELIIDDVIRLNGKREYYSYSFSKKQWNKAESIEKKKASETMYVNPIENFGEIIFTPESKKNVFLPDVDVDTVIASPYPTAFDEDGNRYFQIQKNWNAPESEVFSKLWSDRNGKYEIVATGDFYFNEIAVSNSSKLAIWGSNGRTFLAFLRDGKWIELALLPPEADAPDPDGYTGEYEFLLENCDDGKGMILSEINDPDGYVNVLSQPGTQAPIIAVILKDVPFYYKKTGNGQWSKVLLPSGTVGYVSSDRIIQF